MPSLRQATLFIRLAVIAGLTLSGCRDRNFVTRPGTGEPLASLTSIWPNEDLGGWSYELTHATLSDTLQWYVFPNAADVPPAPSLTALLIRFPTLVPRPSQAIESDTSRFGLHFSGMLTTESGAVGQNLLESYDLPRPGSLAAAGVRNDPFLAQLVRARPEFRTRFGLRATRPASASLMSAPPLFLHGYAWKRTADAIIGYGDLDTLPAWCYLKRDIVAGSEFTQQLVPALATDVLLHARVVGRRVVETPAGTFADAILVVYEVDYGVGPVINDNGNLVGYGRQIAFGSVAYVEDVGPVALSERNLVPVGPDGQIGPGISWNGLGLLSYDRPRLVARR